MWTKFATILAGVLIDKIPGWIAAGSRALFKWGGEKVEQYKRHRSSKKNKKAHKAAKTKEEQRNTFNRLP